MTDDGRGIVPPFMLDALDIEVTCTCDAFDAPHPAGQVLDGVYCETLYTQPTVSPHLFDVAPDGEPS